MRAPVETAIHAMTPPVETTIDAIAATVEAPIDPVSLPIQMPRGDITAGGLGSITRAIQAAVDDIATSIESAIDAITLAVQTLLDAIAAAIQTAFTRRIVGERLSVGDEERKRSQQNSLSHRRSPSISSKLETYNATVARTVDMADRPAMLMSRARSSQRSVRQA